MKSVTAKASVANAWPIIGVVMKCLAAFSRQVLNVLMIAPIAVSFRLARKGK